MPVTAHRAPDDGTLHIVVEGRFDFASHEIFRRAYEQAGRPGACVVDLAKAEYMDSSALGMLIILRDHLGPGVPVRLAHANRGIRNVLAIANFHKLFEIG